MDVAVVGLGHMGRAVAERLLEQGAAVTVFNRSPQPARELAERGAIVAADRDAVWAGGAVAISLLADDAAVKAVWCGEDGLLAAAPAGALLLEMSTISASGSARVADEARRRGVRYLRAPVSGNPSVVTAGNLGIMVSGDRAAFDDARPLLAAIGPKVYYVGDGEQARVLKLALNAMLAGTIQLLAEAITLGEAAGLDRADMLEVISGSAVASPLIGYKTRPLVQRDYTPTFSTVLLLKDLDLALAAAADAGVPLPAAELVRELTAQACADGLADLDFLALVVGQQRRAGRPGDVPPDQ